MRNRALHLAQINLDQGRRCHFRYVVAMAKRHEGNAPKFRHDDELLKHTDMLADRAAETNLVLREQSELMRSLAKTSIWVIRECRAAVARADSMLRKRRI
jgi:hypothetical protein